MEKVSMDKLQDYAGYYPVVVSACLLGEPCRYDGQSKPCQAVVDYAQTHEVIPVCPEQLGGLGTPRTPSEISGGKVIGADGMDRTKEFELGGQAVAALMRREKCGVAVLKENSPSCGVNYVYDGSFTGTLKEGRGITASILARNNFTILSEEDLSWNVDVEKIKRMAAYGTGSESPDGPSASAADTASAETPAAQASPKAAPVPKAPPAPPAPAR